MDKPARHGVRVSRCFVELVSQIAIAYRRGTYGMVAVNFFISAAAGYGMRASIFDTLDGKPNRCGIWRNEYLVF